MDTENNLFEVTNTAILCEPRLSIAYSFLNRRIWLHASATLIYLHTKRIGGFCRCRTAMAHETNFLASILL